MQLFMVHLRQEAPVPQISSILTYE